METVGPMKDIKDRILVISGRKDSLKMLIPTCEYIFEKNAVHLTTIDSSTTTFDEIVESIKIGIVDSIHTVMLIESNSSKENDSVHNKNIFEDRVIEIIELNRDKVNPRHILFYDAQPLKTGEKLEKYEIKTLKKPLKPDDLKIFFDSTTLGRYMQTPLIQKPYKMQTPLIQKPYK